MRSRYGFTLIELVVVVLLAVLAVVAIPRLISLQRQAHIATLRGMQAALEGAASLSYGRSLTAGSASVPNSSLNIEGETVQTVYGYVSSRRQDLSVVLNQALGVSAAQWQFSGTGGVVEGGDAVQIRHTRTAADAICYVEYVNATSAARPLIQVSAAGC